MAKQWRTEPAMIIVLKPGTTEAEFDHVIERIQELGLKPHVSKGEHRTIIGVNGPPRRIRRSRLPHARFRRPVLG